MDDPPVVEVAQALFKLNKAKLKRRTGLEVKVDDPPVVEVAQALGNLQHDVLAPVPPQVALGVGARVQRVEQVLHQLLHDQQHAVALQGPVSRFNPKP